jgi:hypothetical protein
MAEPQEPQVLSSFNAEAIAELQGAIDPREVLVRAQQYPTLRMLLDDKDIKQKIGEALVKNDPELLRGILLGIFNEARTYKRQEMTEVPGPEPFVGESAATAPTLSTQEYVARISEVENASQLVIEQQKIAKRREFARKLTENFIKQTHQTITEEQRQMEINRTERDLSLDWYRNKAEIANTLRQSFLGGPTYQDAVDKVAKTANIEADRVANSEARFEAVITAAASSIAADEVVVHRPDVFIKIAAVQVERSNAPITQIVDRAAALERATVGFTGNEEELPLRLSALAKTPMQKLVAGVVDILPEGPREAIVAGIVGKAWEKAVDTATQYYGQQIVNTDWFGQALTHGSQGLTNTKSALQSLTSGTQKVLADVAVTVFRGEMDEATLAYVENIRQHAAVPKMAGMETSTMRAEVVQQYIITMGPVSYQQFYAAAVYSHNPGLLSYGLSLGLRYATKKAIKAGIKKGVEKAVISTATKGTLEAILGLGTGGIGTLVAIAVDLGWSFLKGLFNKGVSFFKSLVGMGATKNPEDNLLLVIAGAVVLIFFLPLFPLFNIPAFNQSMIDASLATNFYAETGGPPEETDQEQAFSAGTNPGAPIGSTTSSCANISGILLKQCDPQWRSVSFGTQPGCTICSGGCGPTSTTMILRAFGSNASVVDVANKVAALDNGSSCASSPQSNLRVMQDAGLSTFAIGAGDWHEADKVLKNCGLIFALVHTPTGLGHYLVITGLNWDTSGTGVVSYNVLDPYYSSTTHNPSEFGIRSMYGVVGVVK